MMLYLYGNVKIYVRQISFGVYVYKRGLILPWLMRIELMEEIVPLSREESMYSF